MRRVVLLLIAAVALGALAQGTDEDSAHVPAAWGSVWSSRYDDGHMPTAFGVNDPFALFADVPNFLLAPSKAYHLGGTTTVYDAGDGLPAAMNLCEATREWQTAEWNCLKGDGTSEGDGGTSFFSELGSPVKRTIMRCPSGPNCDAQPVTDMPANAAYNSATFTATTTVNGGFTAMWYGIFQSYPNAVDLLMGQTSDSRGAGWAPFWSCETLGLGLNWIRCYLFGNGGGRNGVLNYPLDYQRHLLYVAANPNGDAAMCIDSGCVAMGFVGATLTVDNAPITVHGLAGVAAAQEVLRTHSFIQLSSYVPYTDLPTVLARLEGRPYGLVADGGTVPVTFTRATGSTCDNGDGGSVLVAGQPCYANGKVRAWASVTNSQPRGDEIDNAGAWGDTFFGVGVVAPTLNGADADLSPWGLLTAEDYTFSATGSAEWSLRYSAATACPQNTTAVASCWLKSVSGGTTADLMMLVDAGTGAAAFTASNGCAISTSKWTRCFVSGPTNNNANWQYFYVGLGNPNAGPTRVQSRMLVASCQCEAGSTPSPYCPTTSAAATCDPELVSYDLGADSAGANNIAVGVTRVPRTNPESVTAWGSVLDIGTLSFADNTTGFVFLDDGTGTAGRAYLANDTPSAFTSTAIAYDAGVAHRWFGYTSGGKTQFRYDGVQATESSAQSGAWSAARYLNVGRIGGGTVQSGWYGDLCVLAGGADAGCDR